jgi:hypothetical protein
VIQSVPQPVWVRVLPCVQLPVVKSVPLVRGSLIDRISVPVLQSKHKDVSHAVAVTVLSPPPPLDSPSTQGNWLLHTGFRYVAVAVSQKSRKLLRQWLQKCRRLYLLHVTLCFQRLLRPQLPRGVTVRTRFHVQPLPQRSYPTPSSRINPCCIPDQAVVP